MAERGALYEGAVQVDERLGRVVGAIKVSSSGVVVGGRGMLRWGVVSMGWLGAGGGGD